MTTTDYTQAPATKLVATNCACCGRPLVDAESLASGMGPTCRKRHGFTKKCTSEVRAEVNSIVYDIAANQLSDRVQTQLARLRALGFEKLADRIGKRVGEEVVEISEEDGIISVKSPFKREAVELMRGVPGRKYAGNGITTFPAASRAFLHFTLRQAYPGALATGPKGDFVLAPVQDDETAPEKPVPAVTATFWKVGSWLRVSAPYNVQLVERFRMIPGRSYVGSGVTQFPGSVRGSVESAIRSVFPQAAFVEGE